MTNPARTSVIRARSVDTNRPIAFSNGLLRVSLEGLDPDAAHAWRHQNVGRLLLFAFHAFEERMLAAYHAAGFSDLRQVHLNALRHIDYRGGTRIVELAARAGVTKGAMGQLIEECRKLDLVELRADPLDKRAKIVTFSARGRRVTAVTRRAARRIEKEFAEILGGSRFEHLREELLRLRAGIIDKDQSS
jgi:DNA-binding MarR family transcriptional regulator